MVGLDHSSHDLRRTYVCETVKGLISQGMPKKDAWRMVSESIGHGRLRMERGLMKSYTDPDNMEGFMPFGEKPAEA